jgi:hypothetical protein
VAAQGKHRVSKPETQAQNVLLRKWIISAKKSPDAEAMLAYEEIYRSPLRSMQRSAMRALFMASYL